MTLQGNTHNNNYYPMSNQRRELEQLKGRGWIVGDGQECQVCRRSRRNCECKAPFQVVATWIDGRTQTENAYNRREVRELCDWFRMRQKSDGLYVNRYVDGIGYVLDE